MQSLRNILETKLLPKVEKPIRYLGNEINIIRKDLSKVNLHGVLCFPDLYDIGMSHYGTQLLYHIINSYETWALSRSYHPWEDAENIMRKDNIPLYNLEYCLPVKEADFIGFTLQSELQATNLLNMLDLGNIPLRTSMRTENDPIIIGGGPSLLNPEPFADFFDACLIGDGEVAIVEICKVIEQYKNHSWTKHELYIELSKISGVYVPSLFKVKKNKAFVSADIKSKDIIYPAKISELFSESIKTKPLVPLVNVVHHRLAVEVQRGCTRGCRFCSAGSYYRPVRELTSQQIKELIRHGVETSGWRDVGLLSLSTADHSQFTDVLKSISNLQDEYKLDVSIPSTRIDSLSGEQITLLSRAASTSSFTIAPEAGSQRLRNVINKDFSDDSIFKAVETLLSNNVQTIKLYFMIGLPTENDCDIDAMINLIAKISDMVRQRGKRRSVNVSISPFSPKPHTPFQWEQMDSVESLLSKGKRIKYELGNKRNVKVVYRDPNITYLETVIARGDRTVSSLIYKAWENGAKLDGWNEKFSFNRWLDAQKDSLVDMELFVKSIPEDQVLPWSVVSVGVDTDFLKKERIKALQEDTTPDCRTGHCTNCGGCDIVPYSFAPKVSSEISEASISQKIKLEQDDKNFRYWRVVYTKGDMVRFLSHRDIINLFIRAFTAVSVPVAYSQGYHPNPKFSFGPALPLGYVGKRELLDVVINGNEPINYAKINEILPDGLEIIETLQLDKKPSSLNSSIVVAHYLIKVTDELAKDNIANAVNNFNSSTSVVIPIKRKKGIFDVDIKPLVKSLAQIEDGFTLDTLLSTEEGLMCRPADLIKAIFPESDPLTFIVDRVDCRVRNSNEPDSLIIM